MSEYTSPSVLPLPEPEESNVDRALRLHAAYVAAREATREATAALTAEEFKEFRERVGR